MERDNVSFERIWKISVFRRPVTRQIASQTRSRDTADADGNTCGSLLALIAAGGRGVMLALLKKAQGTSLKTDLAAQALVRDFASPGSVKIGATGSGAF